MRRHAAAYRIIHVIQSEARVGVAHHYRGFKPAHPSLPFDNWIARFISANMNDAFASAFEKGKFSFLGKQVRVNEAIDTQDYLGLNYYSVDMVRFAPRAVKEFFNKRFYPPEARLSTTGFIANVPDGMTMALKWAHRFQKPILILDNGVEDVDDSLRPQYLLEHLHKTWHQVNENMPIKGYFHWSLVDNFEWERGWTQRFGLWGLDPQTQIRTRRPSVDLYSEICHENAISSAMVEKYAPRFTINSSRHKHSKELHAQFFLPL